MPELADGLEERLALDVAHCAAYFNDGNMGFFFCKIVVKPALDFVGDMGLPQHPWGGY